MTKEDAEIPLAERIVAAIGALLVGTAIVLLAISAARHDERPVNITLAVDTIYRAEHGYIVKVAAHNSGMEVASHLELEATLHDEAGGVVEQSRLTLDYLPGRSTRKGAVIFRHDPAQSRLALRALGYEEP